jgi:hypothetical protein
MKINKLMKQFYLKRNGYDGLLKIYIESHDKDLRMDIVNSICFDDLENEYIFDSLADKQNGIQDELTIYVKRKIKK